jgi:hypothetical protein
VSATTPATTEERYLAALKYVIRGDDIHPLAPGEVVDFCAQINDLIATVVEEGAQSSREPQFNEFAVYNLLRLTRELLLVAADDVRARTGAPAARKAKVAA